MGQTADINGLVGKQLCYYDSFVGSTETLTITSVEKDEWRRGYILRSRETPSYFFLRDVELGKLMDKGMYRRYVNIDGDSYHEIYRIQG